MEWSLCKSEIESKVIVVLILWGMRWLYKHLPTLDGLASNEALDEEKIKAQHTPPSTPMPITKKVTDKRAQRVPLPKVITKTPAPLASKTIAQRKTVLGSKRRLFRNILLADALMQRKDFIA